RECVGDRATQMRKRIGLIPTLRELVSQPHRRGPVTPAANEREISHACGCSLHIALRKARRREEHDRRAIRDLTAIITPHSAFDHWICFVIEREAALVELPGARL